MEAAPRTLLEFLPVYRRRHPVDDERVILTLVGFPQGAPRRQMVRMVVFVIVFGVVGGAIGAQGSNFVLWMVASVLVGMAVAVFVRPSRDQAVGVVVSSHRVVVAQHRRRDEPKVLHELRPDAVRRADVETNAEPFFFPKRFGRVSLSGDGGPLLTVDLPNSDPATLWLLLSEAGLLPADAVLPEVPVPDEQVRFWLLKAVPVGFCYVVGVALTIAGVATLVTEELGTGLATFGLGVLLLLIGEGLRRVLLRKRRSVSAAAVPPAEPR